MLNGKIDLRSDTITQPDAAMREAMANAVVGDDVLGDDPTVKELERHTAELLGKAAAVFVPSGTMANQLAIRSLTRPGDAIVLDANAHIHCYEAGAPAALAGVQVSLLDGERGQFTAGQLEAALPPRDVHFAPPSLVCIENTHNRGGGSVWPMEQIESVTSTARGHGLALHLDGARLWNASLRKRRQRGRVRRPLRHSERLFFEGTRRAGRLDFGRVNGRDCQGAVFPQAAGWRDAAGRHPRRGGGACA